MLLRSAITITLLATISGCSDPKAANEANFKKSIQSYLDTAYPKCYIYSEFPTTIDWDIAGNKEKLRALAKTGLVVESEEKVERPSFGNTKRYATLPSFNLTDEGRKFYKPDATKTLSGKSIGGICLGKATVQAVTQFSEPADMLGHRISNVSYTYSVSDLPPWTQSKDVLDAIKELKADVASEQTPLKKQDVLVLTNNGWIHEKLFKK